jgi:hypothetical protein
LHVLAETIDQRYGGQIVAIGGRFRAYPVLRDALDALPGWGPVTVELFLRELRGVWPGAQPPLDDRAAVHLALLDSRDGPDIVRDLTRLSRAGHIDVRDLESGLVRLALAHHGHPELCPGGAACVLLSSEA